MSTPEDNVLPASLRAFPEEDDAFVRAMADAVEATAPSAATSDELGEMVERRLRRTYPNAVIRMQEPLARLAESAGTLYGYRDGGIRATAGDDGAGRLTRSTRLTRPPLIRKPRRRA